MGEHKFYRYFLFSERKFREECWDITERGTVGEQILHLCLLNSSAIHANLAKRLLHHFPKLINDIYNSEEYYGEGDLGFFRALDKRK